MEPTSSSSRRRHGREFKQSAVDRFLAGESATALARELGIRRKLIYEWRDDGFGTNARPKTPAPVAEDPLAQRIAEQQVKIAELERLSGQQAAQLDFFAAALRATKESRPSRSANSAAGSTPRSKV